MIGQAEFGAQVFAVKVDRGFGYDQELSDLLAGFTILDKGCHLHFLGRQENIGVIWTGWSWTAVLTAIGLYVIRMFAITGFYHRYFSMKSEASDA